MTRAFLFVTWCSIRNRALHALRRLRQPRYLVSFIVAAAYFWFLFFRQTTKPGGLPTMTSEIGVDVIAIIVFGILLIAWALPDSSGGVEFSEAEIAMLFPAPLTRRQLLLYKIFRM